MRKNALLLLTAAIALTFSTAAFADQAKAKPSSQSSVYLGGYPDRPGSARVIYEMWYFPCRLASMVSAVAWDVPTGAFQDGIKGSIGYTQTVARNLGKEDGVYELIAGGLVGGPMGAVQGSAYGLVHGFAFGAYHGFVGYPSTESGSHSMLFQGKQYRVPYDDNY